MNDTFWTLISLILFFIVLFFLKVHIWIKNKLDERSKKISFDLEEARRMRDDAQQLLAEYERKRFEIRKEASEIISIAKKEAKILSDEAYQKTQDRFDHINRMIENKISQTEKDIINFITTSAIDLAMSSIEKSLKQKIREKDFFKINDLSLSEIKMIIKNKNLFQDKHFL